MAMHLTRHEMEGIPSKWLEVIVHFLSGFRNDTVDFGRPHLRASVQRIYPLFIVLYAALVIGGTACNVALLFSVFSPEPGGRQGRRRRRSDEAPRTVSGSSTRASDGGRDRRRSLAGSGREEGGGGGAGDRGRGGGDRDPTLCFLANVAAADVVKCLVVLPVSLAVLLVQNWVFGSFMCFFLPMMQDIPIHVTMLSFLLIAADRHRLLMDPMKPRLPPLFCSIVAWLLALCIVLPYPVYTTYLDLGAFMKDQFEGVGICVVNLGDDMQEYMRGLFIAMYVLPLTVIAFLYVRVSRELKMLREGAEESAALAARGPLAVDTSAAGGRGPTAIGSLCPRDLPSAPRGDVGTPCAVDMDGEGERGGRARRVSAPGGGGYWGDGEEQSDAEVDVRREQRTQKYLIAMVVMFAACLFPLMVLRLAKLALTETYENSGHFDIAFTTFVWVAFLPTISTPCLYAAWRLSRPAKDRLRGYFRFGGPRRGGSDKDDDDEEEEGEEDRGCGAVLLGSRRRRRNRRRRRDVCHLTRQQPHCASSSDASVLGLSNVAFASAPPPTASFREGQCTVGEGDVASRLGGSGEVVVLGATDPAIGASRFGKGPFS